MAGKRKGPPVGLQKATCHPNRKKVCAEGLCRACFTQQMVHHQQPSPEAITQFRTDLVSLHQNVAYVKSLAVQAEAILHEHLPDYAEMHVEGAREAASKGDTRPAEWALTRLKPKGVKSVVEPEAKDQGPDNSVRVIIGVKVGGLPVDGLSAQVVNADVSED